MKLGDKVEVFERELVSAGAHIGIVHMVVDQGLITYANPKYKNKSSHRVLIGFEIADDLLEKGNYAGQPKVLSKSYPFGTDAKKSPYRRELLAALEGRELTTEEVVNYPINEAIGKAVQIFVTHDKNEKDPTKVYSNIAGVSPLMKGIKVPDLVTEPLVLDLDNFDPEVFKKLPKWIRETKINLDGIPGIDKLLAEIEAENQAKEDDSGDKSDAIKRAQNV